MSVALPERRTLAYVSMFLVAIFWGLSWPFARLVAINELGPVPITSAFLRIGIAIPFLFVATKLIDKPISFLLPRQFIFPVAILGIMQVSLHNFLWLSSLRYTSGSDGVLILNGTITVVTVMLSPLIYREEQINFHKFLGMLITVSGVAIIFVISPPQDVTNKILGNTLIIVTGLNWALYTIFAKRYLKQIKPLLFQFWASVFGWIILGGATIIEQNLYPTTFISSSTLLNLLYLGIFSAAVAYSLYNISIKEIGSSRTSLFINLSPFFGIVFSVLLADEIFSIWYFVAFVIILLGIYTVESSQMDPSKFESLSQAIE